MPREVTLVVLGAADSQIWIISQIKAGILGQLSYKSNHSKPYMNRECHLPVLELSSDSTQILAWSGAGGSRQVKSNWL